MNQEILSYLQKEHAKVLKKIGPLLKRKQEIEKAFEELKPTKKPENVVLVTLYQNTAKMITRDNITGYPINKNPNVTRDIKDMLKNKQRVEIFNDSQDEEQYDILKKLSETFKIPFANLEKKNV